MIILEDISFERYQSLAFITSGAGGDDPELALTVSALGLAGEAGEVADLIKKMIGHGHSIPKAKLLDEIGDVLWYIADICSKLGLDMEKAASGNIAKLAKRYPDGFSEERSKNRKA